MIEMNVLQLLFDCAFSLTESAIGQYTLELAN